MGRVFGFSHYRWFGAGLLWLGVIFLPSWAQPPRKDPTKSSPTIKLPSGTIIVVTDKLGESLEKTDAIYLTPEKFKELTEQIEQLKKQLQATEKAVPPSECRIEGRIESRGREMVGRLKATLRFKTTQPRNTVYLGFQNAQPFDPKFSDGKLPVLIKTEQGLSILVESAGEHTLQLELESPLTSRGTKGTESGFEIGLPGSPITLLNMALPANAKRISTIRKEVGSAVSETRSYTPDQIKASGEGLPLGPISNLELFWEDLESTPKDLPRSAENESSITLTDTELLCESKLRLTGSTKEWRFVAPSNAEVQVRRAPLPSDPMNKATELPFEQAPTIVRPDNNQLPIWRLQFSQPNSVDLLVLINSRQSRPASTDPRSKGPYSLGPVGALDVASQNGTIRIKTPPQVRIQANLKGDTRRIDSGDDPLAEAVFRYNSLPKGNNSLPGSPLEIEVRTVPGSIQSTTVHRLQQVERGWRLRTEFQINPIRVDLDRVELEIPAANDFQDTILLPTEILEGSNTLREVSPQRRVIQVKFLNPQRAPFTLSIEGIYPLAANVSQAQFHLPRLLNTLERESQVLISLPEGQEIRGHVRSWQNEKIGSWELPLKLEETQASLSLQRTPPAMVDFSWKPQQPNYRVESIADLTLMDGSHRIQQQIKCTFTGKPPRKIRLKLSEHPLLQSGVAVNLGRLESLGGDQWQWTLPIGPGNEVTFKATYVFRDDPKAATFAVPLFWPEGTQQTQSRVRVWRDPLSRLPGIPINASDNRWQERPPEILPEERTLPMLVLASFDRMAPLSLEWQTDSNRTIPAWPIQVWADRVLMQVQILDANQQYRLRMPLRKWLGKSIDFELPPGVSEVEIYLNGRRVELMETNRSVQVPLPGFTGESLQFELRYLINSPVSLSWKFIPPRFRETVSLGAIRYQMSVPARWNLLCLSDRTIFEERWTIRNGLPVAVAGRSQPDLEMWLNAAVEPRESDSWKMSEGNITFRQLELEPIRFLILPRLLWISTISLVILAIGMMLSRLARGAVWMSLALLGILAVALFFIWPQVVRQTIAASIPGLAVLILVLCLQRYLQWRYRRQIMNIPGFRRSIGESTLSRSSNPRPMPLNLPREASTIDSPPG